MKTLKKKIKKKINLLNYFNYFFLKKFINKKNGSIFFKKKYKKKIPLNSRNKIKLYIKRLRYLSLFPYTFKHFKKNTC